MLLLHYKFLIKRFSSTHKLKLAVKLADNSFIHWNCGGADIFQKWGGHTHCFAVTHILSELSSSSRGFIKTGRCFKNILFGIFFSHVHSLSSKISFLLPSMWIIRNDSLCPQGQVFACLPSRYSVLIFHLLRREGAEGCFYLSPGPLSFLIYAAVNRSHCSPVLTPLWLPCEFSFCFLKDLFNLNVARLEREKKSIGNNIKSGQDRSHKYKWQKWTVIMVARWQVDCHRQGFSSLCNQAPNKYRRNGQILAVLLPNQLPQAVLHTWVLRPHPFCTRAVEVRSCSESQNCQANGEQQHHQHIHRSLSDPVGRSCSDC